MGMVDLCFFMLYLPLLAAVMQLCGGFENAV